MCKFKRSSIKYGCALPCARRCESSNKFEPVDDTVIICCHINNNNDDVGLDATNAATAKSERCTTFALAIARKQWIFGASILWSSLSLLSCSRRLVACFYLLKNQKKWKKTLKKVWHKNWHEKRNKKKSKILWYLKRKAEKSKIICPLWKVFELFLFLESRKKKYKIGWPKMKTYKIYFSCPKISPRPRQSTSG